MTCVECKGQISSSARACPRCGHPSGDAWGSCPECKANISVDADGSYKMMGVIAGTF